MKKIILTLFLVLGVASLAAPSHVDTNKIKQNGYKSVVNSKHLYSASKQIDDNSSLNMLYSAGILLDDDSIKIKPTIFLQNYITLQENYIPIWKELEDFALKTLVEIVIPEVYPEDFIDED